MLIVDASILLAAADASEADHPACARLLQDARKPVAVPGLVLAEAAYLIGNRLGPRAEIELVHLIQSGDIAVEAVADPDWARIAELMQTFVSLPLGAADASMIVLAERLAVDVLGTLDRRHFSVVRPRHVEAFTLVP